MCLETQRGRRVVIPLGGAFILSLSDRRLREEGGYQFLQILPASVEVGEQLAAHLLRVELALKAGEQLGEAAQFRPEIG